MPRPRKCRKVCCLPKISEFVPACEIQPTAQAVVLTVDEYESIRLIDKEGFSQEECSAYMHVARTTVQQIYTSARKKLALVLVDGRPCGLRAEITAWCDGQESTCGCGGCRRHRCPS